MFSLTVDSMPFWHDDYAMQTGVRGSLSDQIAEEIRAMMARRRVSGRQLAQLLDVSPAWVSYRLTGTQEIGVNDLERIAEALDAEVLDLLPRRLTVSHTARYVRVTEGTSLGIAPSPAEAPPAPAPVPASRPALPRPRLIPRQLAATT